MATSAPPRTLVTRLWRDTLVNSGSRKRGAVCGGRSPFEAAGLTGCNTLPRGCRARPLLPPLPRVDSKETAHTSHLWCRFAAPAYLRCVPRNCGNEAPRSASHEEARAPFSSCTAIVAAWWKPLLFGRCRRIHAPPPPLTTFVSGVWPVMHLIRGKERRQHSPSLPFCPSSFSSRGRCRLPRLRVEFAPLPPFPFIFVCAHSGTNTFLHTCTLPSFAVRMPYLP